jgi:3-phosphoshikimate 1-carboxyvinyltransferase
VVVIDGDAHMRKRPIMPAGRCARWASTHRPPDGCPPVTMVAARRFRGGRVEIDGGPVQPVCFRAADDGRLRRGPVDIVLAGDDIGARGYID